MRPNLLPIPLAAALAAPLLAQSDAPSPPAPKPTYGCGSRVELAKVWRVLCTNHDRDADGTITKDEYPRGDARFANFDRDGDGVLTARDFPAGAFVNGFNSWLVRMADGDRDGKVARAEWDAFAKALDADADGVVSPDELAAKVGPSAAQDFDLFLLSFDQDLDGRFTPKDLAIAFADLDVDGDGILAGKETERWRPTAARPSGPLPKVGAAAPPFDLPRADDPKQRIALASFRGQKPVALVFGSYT
jgi:Ca2+-binding EF-hand superfamily protein